MRPKSLSIGTPTKLLSLEEAQSKRLGSDSGQDNYIEVGESLESSNFSIYYAKKPQSSTNYFFA